LNKDKGNKLKHNILIIGDSHSRALAINLRHNLNDEYKVQGLTKPGSDLSDILNSNIQDITEFTKKDVVIIWGGMKDVSRNESSKGLTEIRNFMGKRAHKYHGDKLTHKMGPQAHFMCKSRDKSLIENQVNI
jgi:predicted phosphodiesterase